MALVVNDRVKETSTTTGTGTLTLDGAVTGFETFSSAIGNTNTTYYAIELPNTAEFEVGLGTVSAGQLARTTVISSSNSDALVNFSAGTKNVFCTLPASKAVIEDASNNVTLPADLTVDTNTLYVDSSNNRVGINDSTPSQALDVSGRSRSTRFVSSTGGAAADAAFYLNDTNGLGIFSPTANEFAISTSASERLRIDSSGNVGIGTTSPVQRLHVHNAGTGSSDHSYIQITTGDTGETSSDGLTLGVAASNAAYLYNREANRPLYLYSKGNIQFATGSSSIVNRLNIAEDGTIIFNDTGAATDLRIEGDSEQNLFFVDGSTDRIGIGTSSPGTALHMRIDGGDANLLLERSTAGVTSKWGIKPYDDKLHFRDESASPIIDNFTMTSDGYFGIGTPNPSAPLEITTTTTDDSVLITTTEDSSTAAPVITLKRNSASPADGDYLGQLKFKGENDADQEVVYAKITGKISDVTDTTEDGLIEFALRKAGSNNIGARLTSTDLKLINGTNLDIESADPQITITDTDGTGSQVIKAVTDNLEIVSSNHIKFDADSGLFVFKDSGVDALSITNTGNIIFKPVASDSDLVIKGNDGGSEITALTLDMSEAGAATFNDKVILGANKVIEFGDAGETISGDGTDLTISASSAMLIDVGTTLTLDGATQIALSDSGTNYGAFSTASNAFRMTSQISDNDILFRGNDGGSFFTALTLDMSEAGAATFNSSVTVGANLDVSSGTIKLDGNYPTGTNNVAMGDTALDSVTTGSSNTMIGHQSGTDLLGGGNNTGIGNRALANITSANHNTAVGSDALLFATTGGGNTAIGRSAMQTERTGGSNVAVGRSALITQNGGGQNTGIGYQAGNIITTGSNLTLLGYDAQPSSATATNEITLGDANVTSLRIPGLASGASSGDVLTYDGTDITLSAPTGVSAGFAVAMAIAL
jgi:hypothetical protein